MPDLRRQALLQRLGFDHWVKRGSKVRRQQGLPSTDLPATASIVAESDASVSHVVDTKKIQHQVVTDQQPKLPGGGTHVIHATDISTMDYAALTSTIQQCTACDLHQRRKQAVVGCGHLQADWLIIGEAPGEQEDLKGEPFIGRAGLLLNNMLLSIGLQREDIYISNIVKCRPPDNRDPRVDEMAACDGYLNRQIELISPSLILVVGRIAAQHLLQTSESVAKLRGKTHKLPSSDIPLVVTYHPAYLLRKPQEKSKVWQDLKFARQAFTLNANSSG